MFNNFFNQYIQTLGVVQEKGNSTTEVMSQKSVTDELNNGVPENKLFYKTTVFDEMQADNSFVRGKFLNSANTKKLKSKAIKDTIIMMLSKYLLLMRYLAITTVLWVCLFHFCLNTALNSLKFWVCAKILIYTD